MSCVATKLIGLESCTLYTHCYGHALNLETQDALNGIENRKDTLDAVFEIIKLIKKSPKRDFCNNWFSRTSYYMPNKLQCQG